MFLSLNNQPWAKNRAVPPSVNIRLFRLCSIAIPRHRLLVAGASEAFVAGERGGIPMVISDRSWMVVTGSDGRASIGPAGPVDPLKDSLQNLPRTACFPTLSQSHQFWLPIVKTCRNGSSGTSSSFSQTRAAYALHTSASRLHFLAAPVPEMMRAAWGFPRRTPSYHPTLGRLSRETTHITHMMSAMFIQSTFSTSLRLFFFLNWDVWKKTS